MQFDSITLQIFVVLTHAESLFSNRKCIYKIMGMLWGLTCMFETNIDFYKKGLVIEIY